MDTLTKSMKGLNDATSRIGEKLNEVQSFLSLEEVIFIKFRLNCLLYSYLSTISAL
jgi:hypothetical protein